MMIDYLILLRPRHWVKNVFVLAPLIFSGQFLDPSSILRSLAAFALFSIGASIVYVINDLNDIEEDRKHPVKSKKRPLAKGTVTKQAAIIIAGILGVLFIIGAYFLPRVAAVIIGYIVFNYFYSVYFKRLPVVDIFSVAFGFVLRVLAGTVALAVPMSGWMFVTTLTLALYLAAIKRRQELITLGDQTGRDILQQYSVALIDRFAEMSATGSLVFYSLFVLDTHPDMIPTIPFVIFGLFYYWYLVETKGEGESPTDVLLRDPVIQIVCALWAGMCLYFLMP
jgi:4-hydroxybenzoate polyprenyltransferase